jgi:hypothetical protein
MPFYNRDLSICRFGDLLEFLEPILHGYQGEAIHQSRLCITVLWCLKALVRLLCLSCCLSQNLCLYFLYLVVFTFVVLDFKRKLKHLHFLSLGLWINVANVGVFEVEWLWINWVKCFLSFMKLVGFWNGKEPADVSLSVRIRTPTCIWQEHAET